MPVIVYDATTEVMGTDSRELFSDNFIAFNNRSKILKTNDGSLIGVIGKLSELLQVTQWFGNSTIFSTTYLTRKLFISKDSSVLIVLPNNKVYQYDSDQSMMIEISDTRGYYAIGDEAAHNALIAMDCGKTVEEAITIVCGRLTNCSLPVSTLSLT